MRNTELSKFKEELLLNKQKIEGALKLQSERSLEMQAYNEAQDIMSRNDESAEEISELITNLAINESLEKTLKDITQALEMMEQGSYGVCKYCSKDIPIARMRIRPVSSSCVECKSRFTN